MLALNYSKVCMRGQTEAMLTLCNLQKLYFLLYYYINLILSESFAMHLLLSNKVGLLNITSS